MARGAHHGERVAELVRDGTRDLTEHGEALLEHARAMREAAEALRLTAQDLLSLGVIDRIIPEPMGGAQRDPAVAMEAVGDAIASMLAELVDQSPDKILKDRRKKFLEMGSKGLAA